MTERVVASGDVLIGRYRLDDLVSDSLGALHWRAHDLVLNRNVGVELLPVSDPRAEHFLAAAKSSTAVRDHRFLQVLDVLDDEMGHCVVIREWARATSLAQLLASAPLTNSRAATVVMEVAEAFATAHEAGVYHQRLMPHHVLLKQSGAVRIVGLGVADALAPADRGPTPSDLEAYERLDVLAIGKLLYACLVSRWPGSSIDGLRAAPVEHGHLLRPRQVRAGVASELDTLCTRILDPDVARSPLTSAGEIAQALRTTPSDLDGTEEVPVVTETPDVLRADPVIRPSGPPPGLEPPRRRPKAFTPRAPTMIDRGKEAVLQSTRGGDRKLIIAGMVGALAILIAVMVLIAPSILGSSSSSSSSKVAAASSIIPITSVTDFDPLGSDHSENPDLAPLAIDGDPSTGWYTQTYRSSPEFGHLKSGVGLVVDLSSVHSVSSVALTLTGEPSTLSILVPSDQTASAPTAVDSLEQVAHVADAGTSVTLNFKHSASARYVVIWFESLPQISSGSYRGQVDEIVVRGS
jgi:serine/threonine protein kinase